MTRTEQIAAVVAMTRTCCEQHDLPHHPEECRETRAAEKRIRKWLWKRIEAKLKAAEDIKKLLKVKRLAKR